MRKLVAALFLMSIVGLPGIAKASFFDSGAWYMSSSQWDLVGVSDAENRSSFQDGFDNLNWLANAPAAGNPASRTLASKWAFDLNQDFSFGVLYHYSHEGTFEGDEGSIEMGLFNLAAGDNAPSTRGSIKAANIINPNVTANIYGTSFQLPGQSEADILVPRGGVFDGAFSAVYNSSADVLQLSTIDPVAGVLSNNFDNVRSISGATGLRVYFTGSSNLSTLGPNEAYFNSFTVNGGTMTPEPVSSALFISGGLVFASKRLFRRNKKA